MVEAKASMEFQQLVDLQRARRTVRLMAQGVMPAYDIAKKADEVLREVAGSGQAQRQALRLSQTVMGYVRMGVAPAHHHCLEADRQIESVINEMLTRQQTSHSQGADVETGQEDQVHHRSDRMRG